MSSFLPAPLTIVVFSLSITLSWRDRARELDVLELGAGVFRDGLAAGEAAMSLMMALRRSPKPGAFTTTMSGRRETVDDQGGQGFVFHSSADDHQRLAGVTTLEQRQSSFIVETSSR